MGSFGLGRTQDSLRVFAHGNVLHLHIKLLEQLIGKFDSSGPVPHGHIPEHVGEAA